MNTNMTLEKRILSVLLTVIMVFSMVPLSVFAADGGAATVITSGGEVAFNVYKDAVAYANQHDGSTIKLQSDIDVLPYEDPADMPSITGNVTLDLNGKSINCVDVGSVSFDEEGEIVKDKAGTLTVTGSGSIGLLTMYCGALTLNSGTVEELRAEDFAVTVHITGGTVESLVLSLRWDDNATADISGGSVQKLDLGTGTVNITGGSHGSETASWGVNGGTLNISGGSFSALRLFVTSGKIDLTGGEFEYISTDPQAPFSEYQKLTMGSLLGDSCAFYSKDGSLVSADVLTLENVKVVADHEHTYKDGKCTTCGALCKHDRVDTAMGRCEVCGIQLEAEISAEGASPVFYTSFIQAWDALQPNRSDQVTVTLLKPRYDLGEMNLYVQSNNIRLDLNSNVMFGTGKIVVSGAQAVFTVENGDMNEITVEAADGAVTVGEDCGSIKAVRVTSTDAAVTIQSGFFKKLVLPATDTESLKNVKLSGGEFDSISFNGTGTVAITDMLEAGYAFQDNKGTASGKAGALVPYGMSFDAKTYFADLEVVKCGHSAVNEVKGYCNYCGKLYAGKITDKDGAVRYVESLQDSDFGNGNTVTLLQDITGTVTPGSSCTIELRGRSVGQIDFAVQDGTLTLKGQGKIGTVTLGSGEIDSTLAIEDTAYWQRVKIGTLTINKTTNTRLSGGQFDKIERKDGGFVEALLADGYAYFDREWEMPEYAGGKTSLTKTYYIAEHSHWFIVNIEGETQCQDCGMPCHHTTIGEDGKCQDVCHRQIYTAVLTRADGTAKNYESFADAWAAAMTDSGSTLRLLCDVTLGEAEDGIIAGSGKFTLDLGGKTISGTITNQLLTVKGTADITVKNGALTNTFSDNSGKVELDTANALKIDGGAVTLEKVKLTSGRGDQGGHTHAALLLDGSLTVLNGTFNGELSVERKTSAAQPVLKITEAALNDGISYSYIYEGDPNAPDDQVRDYAAVKAIFADGSMLFEEGGRYIDVTDEDLWSGRGTDGVLTVGFSYGEACTVKPHTHDTFVDGKCAECDYACPHDSGKNDREASYFQKAICSVCHAEYGDFVQDTVEPVGKIEIKERTWWQSFINTITFSLFYKEKVTVEITASDDSYSQAGYDETKHAVKIEYFISNTALSEDTVKGSDFTKYNGEIDLSDDCRYVVYAKLTDYAGNVSYISTDGFVVDTTPPVIEVDADGQSKQYSNGQRAEVCGGAQIKFIDDNFDTAYRTIDGVKDKIWSSPFLVAASDTDRTERWITFEVHDKAGNISTVEVYVHKEHSFDEETGVCAYCGYQAAVLIKCSNDNNEEEFVSGDGLDETMRKVDENKFDRFYLKLYGNVEKKAGVVTYGSTSKKWTFDLNGYTISNPPSVDPNPVAALFYVAGDITFVGNGGMNADVVVDGGQLTIDGECSFQKLEHKRGTLTVNAGSFESLIISKLDVNWSYTRETALCGGHYGEVKIVDIEGLTCADLLARGYRFEGLTLEQAKVTELKDATIVACDHADIGSDGICPDCGMEFFLSVEANGTTKLFETFESAIRYAEQNDGCTVKLLKDITVAGTSSMVSHYRLALTEGSYTLDLAGKTLTVGVVEGSYLTVSVECDLTISDSVGGGKIVGETGAEAIEVRGKLTVSGGDFTEIYKIEAYGADSLVLEGGSFKMVSSAQSAEAVSPLSYLAEERAYQLTTGDNRYANESDVVRDTVGTMTTCYIRNVSVVSAPLKFHSQPRNKVYYLTTPNYEKWAAFAVEYSGGYPPKGDITVTGEKTDGTVVYTNTVKPTRIFEDAINLWEFTTADSGQYRIKLEYNGYVLYSNTFTITMAVCEHPGYDEYNKCSQCGCDLAAAIVKDGKTTGYVTFAEALAAAQTDENKDCTLRLLANVKGTVDVDTGDFSIDLNGNIVGGLKVKKSAKVNVSGGTVSGGVTVAKTAQLTASNTYFTGAINCVGSGDFRDCIFMGAVSPKGGSSMKLNSCEINGELSVSGNAEADECIVSGTVTVNNGGSLKSAGGAYGNIVNVKSGGTLEIISGTFDKKLTAEAGSKLIVSGGSYAEVGAENNVDFTLSGGEFTNITVNGQHLIDCLAEGKAFEDMNNSFIIDGRVGIAGDVKVVDHTHTCIWKTSTHEKLCGCGYVEAVDTEAPVISGIDPENNHYGSLEFTVTDANDFTVWIDDEEITLVNGKYTMEPDNETHLITATDIAGNTVSFRFGIFKTYHVTLPTGVGYIIHSRESTVRHGDSYDFIVEFNNGYSRTEDFKVLVNGNKLDELSSDRDSASFVVRDVSEDLVITVEGMADITAPEVEVSIRGNSFKEFLNRITFGLFFKQTQTVEVKAHDFGSGIKKVEYLLSETAFADKDAITGSWTELDLNDAFKAYFSIEPSQKTFVYVRVTDMSDNITVVNTDGMVVYTDAEAVTGAQTFTKTTDSDVVYKLNLNGNFVAKVYNGTEEIGAGSDYALLANGMLMLKNSYLRTLAAGEYTIRLTIKPMGENYADNSGNDAPADVVMKLTVEKKAPTLDHTPSDGKIYDGKPIGKPTLNTDSDGALIFEYKRADEEDTAYTTEAPKNVGKYTIRITTAETDTFKSASSTMEFEIQPKEVTISDVKVADKTYDGSPDAKITEKGTFDGLINGDKVDIVTGKAAYDDKNVGNGKTVAFYDFALSGDDAANYVLAAQPANTTASISAKELTIADLKVKDKQYDGKNTAAIDGTPALVGVVDGDMLTLINGVPTFDSVKIGKDIAISFTAFTLSGDSVTVGNYTLIQPSGITANIVEYVATGDEYSVNSNDWINKDFVITAKAGYALSLTDTANGEWSNTLSAAGETGKGRLTFYVKNTATGVISAAVTENYKIDKTAPTGEVKLNERTAFQKFINTITFGLFFKDDVNVKLTAKDEASGVKSVMYFKSDRILTDEEVRAITDWTDNSDFDIEAKDMDKFVIYVRIEDNAGNVTLIGSDGATFDTTAPEIVGVENDKTYYVTKKIAIDDENLASVTLNGETVEDVFTLVGDKDATYVIRTEDKAGNVTEYTVYMKPISSITDAISAITADNVKSSDAETISSVERQILDIAEAFDDGESTEDEWNKLTAAAAKCKDLNKRIAEVADEITRLTDAVNGYDIDKVTSDDKADVEKLIADIDTLLDGDNLTDTERAALEALKGTARALLDRIAAAKDATEADEITVIDGITKDNVKLGDKEALETAEKALEGALRDFEGNYTDEEQEDLETRLETVKAALAAIGNAEKAAEEIGKLPSADDAKLSDKSDLDRVKKLLEGLTENEKAMLDKDALGKVDALAEKIQKLAEEANSPKTGDTSNLALWIALLFISGGAVIGTTVVSKKQKHSAK